MVTSSWRLAASLVPVFIASACSAPPIIPDRLMDVHQAFASGADATPPAAHSYASRSSIFGAAFEDVYRAASVSASQAQFVVEDERKNQGLILATRSAQMVPVGTQYNAPTQHRFYFAIVVRELQAKRTEVRISAKVQGKCSKLEGGTAAFVNIGTLGTVSGQFRDMNAYCDALAGGMWAGKNHSADDDLARFLTFVRNNLIAAGAL